MTVEELLEEIGITYRQFDYWCRIGFIPRVPKTGSGNKRRLSDKQVVFARTMAKLVRAGFRPGPASKLAPHIIENGMVLVDLEDGSILSIALVDKE